MILQTTNYLKTEMILKTDLNYEDNIITSEYSLNLKNTLKTDYNSNTYAYDTHIICYDNCEKCEGFPEMNDSGEMINQKCLTCKEGYHLVFQTNNCYNNSILEEGYYFSQNDFTYHKCNTNCKKCLQDSTFNNSICISCIKDTYLFSLHNSCLHFCPPNYEINNDHNKCIFKNFDQTTSLSDFKDQIINDITSFADSPNVINGSDFMVFSR